MTSSALRWERGREPGSGRGVLRCGMLLCWELVRSLNNFALLSVRWKVMFRSVRVRLRRTTVHSEMFGAAGRSARRRGDAGSRRLRPERLEEGVSVGRRARDRPLERWGGDGRMVLEPPVDGGWERLTTWMVERVRAGWRGGMIGDGEDSGMSSNNSLSDGFSESSFSMVLRCKTKLAASLARCRVKHHLHSVSCFLSDPVRAKQHRAKCLPLYGWVNMLKTSVEEVCEALRSAGLCEVKNIADLRGPTFCRDPLCPDTLVFTQQLHALLQQLLTAPPALYMQDRSVCVAVSVLRPLLFENGDVLVAGSFSAVTVAHVAVVAAARSGRVLVCGADHTPSHIEEIQELLTQMDLKNVRVLSEAFCGLDEWDAAVQKLKVIIVLPQCSSTALNDPVPTIHSEHGDWDLLPDLSQGPVSKSRIHTMAAKQARLLSQALSFPKVQTVVYCTRSVYPEENEQLVKRVLEKTHTHPKLLPFRVNGPIFPDDSQSGDATTDSRFFRLEQSQFTNGCFVARLSRQADPTKVETVQDVLARAAAKGLLGGVISEQPKNVKKGKGNKNRGTSASSRPSSPSSQERQDPASEHEEKNGECDEEVKEGGKKKKVLKGSKRKVKQRPKQSNRATAVSKPHKKKPTKRRVKTKPRRIPRLTLTLMSSAKPSNRLSPITALAHKLSDNTSIKSQQTVFSTRAPASPAPPAPHAASKQVKRQNPEPERAEKTQKDATKPESQFKTESKTVRTKTEVVTQNRSKAADSVLPPISFPSPRSLSSRSGSSHSQRLSRASSSHLAQITASCASTISLPGL